MCIRLWPDDLVLVVLKQMYSVVLKLLVGNLSDVITDMVS